jgi:hypothetical protein
MLMTIHITADYPAALQATLLVAFVLFWFSHFSSPQSQLVFSVVNIR